MKDRVSSTTLSRLDAAEAELLNLVPADYIVGQLPSIENHVARHLQPTDRAAQGRTDRRPGQHTAAAARHIDCTGSRRPQAASHAPADYDADMIRRAARIVDDERMSLVTAMRGASSAALREQTRVRSFRNAVVAATAGMLLVAIGLVLLGALDPTAVPLCFSPQEGDDVTIVCPTEQSGPIEPGSDDADSVTATEINSTINSTVGRIDMATVAIIGSTAAAVAAAAAIRRIRGSSEPYGVPIALAVLKLPTGAVTAILGLVLIRGGFIPGLSALDTSAQILAWAAIFGYAQQLFTRLVDQQATAVLDNVRGGDKGTHPARSE